MSSPGGRGLAAAELFICSAFCRGLLADGDLGIFGLSGKDVSLDVGVFVGG
jgi:hypothetical protein